MSSTEGGARGTKRTCKRNAENTHLCWQKNGAKLVNKFGLGKKKVVLRGPRSRLFFARVQKCALG